MGDIKDFFIFIICHSCHSLFFYIKYLDVTYCDFKKVKADMKSQIATSNINSRFFAKSHQWLFATDFHIAYLYQLGTKTTHIVCSYYLLLSYFLFFKL